MSQEYRTPCVLAIGGFDPSGGAGLLLDSQAIRATGAHAAAVLSLTTLQDGQRFIAAWPHPEEEIRAAVELMAKKLDVRAVKTGALGNARIVDAVAAVASDLNLPNLIVDPVTASTTRGGLLDPEGVDRLTRHMAPRITLLTPNRHEAEILSGTEVHDLDGMRRAAESILSLGVGAVLVKGGHLSGNTVTDLLLDNTGSERVFEYPRHAHDDVRGTGCALASLVAGYLAMGSPLTEAVTQGRQALQRGIETAYEVNDGPRILGSFR